LFHQFWMIVLLGRVLGLKLFSFSAQNASLYALPAFKVSVEKSSVILMGLPLYVIFFLSCSLQYSFCSLCLLFW
jgi:hypothetical protein